MAFKLFYTDYTKDEHVRSDEAKPATIEQITACMTRLLDEEDNFIGIIDADDVMLQFMAEEDGSICIDAPVHERKGSFMKNTDLSECLKIVSEFQTKITIDNIEGLEFQTWGR